MKKSALVFLFMAVASVIVVAFAGQELRHEGTISTIEKTRIQITRTDKASPRDHWFGITAETPVVEGDRSTTFDAAKLKKNIRVVVTTLAPDGPPLKEWSCTMHTHITEEHSGKCPVCGMALVERDRAPQAKEIRVAGR